MYASVFLFQLRYSKNASAGTMFVNIYENSFKNNPFLNFSLTIFKNHVTYKLYIYIYIYHTFFHQMETQNTSTL